MSYKHLREKFTDIDFSNFDLNITKSENFSQSLSYTHNVPYSIILIIRQYNMKCSKYLSLDKIYIMTFEYIPSL